MNPVVTARVPEGVRLRGQEVLKEIGSTTSELINAAFDYVIQERQLPKPQKQILHRDGAQTLTDEQRQNLANFIESVRVPIPASWNNAPFEELFDEAMEDRYADLR